MIGPPTDCVVVAARYPAGVLLPGIYLSAACNTFAPMEKTAPNMATHRILLIQSEGLNMLPPCVVIGFVVLVIFAAI
jgi:hypothetical protein